MNEYKVFHSTPKNRHLRSHIHPILVRPEEPRNVGSIARALENMEILGPLRIVGSPDIVQDDARRLAKHAGHRLDEALFFPTLSEALMIQGTKPLALAATARIGSAARPHPTRVREAVARAVQKLREEQVRDLAFVFGPESDGLTNPEIELCDWVVTIPSTSQYRSLNLSQALLIFCYEANLNLLEEWESFTSQKPGQKGRLVSHIIELAEVSGFVLPGDPMKMKPRLEEIFSKLPHFIPEAKTLHGLLDQAIRSVKKGAVDIRGRYRKLPAQTHEVQDEHRT